MILFIMLSFLVAKLCGKRLRVLLREKSLYPLWMVVVVFFVAQICALNGDYRFIRYGQLLQTANILALLWPVLRFRLYPQAVAGMAMVCVGSLLNTLVINANDGRMPVYPTLSRLTGYYQEGALVASGDMRHVLMSETTRLGFLADYIDTGFSVMSLGDLLIHSFTMFVIFGVIAALNTVED